MDVLPNAIPPGAYATSIVLLCYSGVCLASSVLLACMLIRNGEKINCTF